MEMLQNFVLCYWHNCLGTFPTLGNNLARNCSNCTLDLMMHAVTYLTILKS